MAAPRNPTSELIHRLARGNIPQVEITRALSTILDARDYMYSIQQLPEQDLRMWVERLDQIIDSGICTEQLRRRSLCSLRKTCGSRRVLPKSHYFPGKLSKIGTRPVSGGSTADVWRATDDRMQTFAVKVFRANRGDDYKIKRYYKEITVWKRLNHPNVVPTLGAGPDIAELCTVSPWMPNGHLLQYLNKHPGANRVAIMIGVVDGLSYLHLNDVIHGDLKGENILFDNAGIPRMSDFGISSMTFDPISNHATTALRGYSVRWAAPEILEAPDDSEARRPTRMSDVYAFGMVVVEIFTGRLPFPDDTDLRVQLKIARGKRPSKPANASKLGLSSTMWKLVEDCWNKKRDKRPEIQYIASHLPKPW